jgi:hypothetical protein
MKLVRVFAASMVVLAAALAAPVTVADTADADCILRKDGDTKEGASGHCTFSQRQGYVDIDLRNGATFSLTPGDQPNHYRDQEGKKIIVTFRSGSSEGGHGGGNVAETPQDLRDLPGSKYVGGEVDDEMMRRGYRHVRDEQSGGQIWSYWRANHGGHCVVVHMGEGRHVKSVANAMESSCK